LEVGKEDRASTSGPHSTTRCTRDERLASRRPSSQLYPLQPRAGLRLGGTVSGFCDGSVRRLVRIVVAGLLGPHISRASPESVPDSIKEDSIAGEGGGREEKMRRSDEKER